MFQARIEAKLANTALTPTAVRRTNAEVEPACLEPEMKPQRLAHTNTDNKDTRLFTRRGAHSPRT